MSAVTPVTKDLTWQWQLSSSDSNPIDETYDVDIYDIDLDSDQDIIDRLKAKGIMVICYINVGAWEDYRDDASQFDTSVLGKAYVGYPNEKWLDVGNYQKFSSIMEARFDKAVTKGCDGIEPDNVDGYAQNTGFTITYDQQVTYNKWLATEAHSRSLSIALKNDIAQLADLADDFDFAVSEQCWQYDECSQYQSYFLDNNKAVLNCEYRKTARSFCEEANSMGIMSLRMDKSLDGFHYSCWDSYVNNKNFYSQLISFKLKKWFNAIF